MRKVVAVGKLAEQSTEAKDSSNGSRPAQKLDLTLISECSGSSINVEYGNTGLKTVDIEARGLYSLYQEIFFGQTHYLFVGRVPGVGNKVVAVLRMPDFQSNSYRAFVINQFGFFETWIDQRLVVGEENLGGASPVDLERKLLTFFHEYWGTQTIDYKLLDARVGTNDRFSALAAVADKQGVKAEVRRSCVSVDLLVSFSRHLLRVCVCFECFSQLSGAGRRVRGHR